MSDPTEGLDLWLATIKKQIEDFAAESRLSDSAQDSALSQLAKVVEHQESEIGLLKLALGELDARVVALEGFKQPGRESLVPGDYIPGEATTGSYGELLKRVGNLTTTKDGEVFEGLYIEGQITINHSVTFKRCHIKGATPAAASYAVVRCYKAIAKPAQMIDCTIEATLDIGACNNGGLVQGSIHRALLLDGIDGTIVASPDFTAPMGPRQRDAQGNIWTINGSAYAWEYV